MAAVGLGGFSFVGMLEPDGVDDRLRPALPCGGPGSGGRASGDRQGLRFSRRRRVRRSRELAGPDDCQTRAQALGCAPSSRAHGPTEALQPWTQDCRPVSSIFFFRRFVEYQVASELNPFQRRSRTQEFCFADRTKACAHQGGQGWRVGSRGANKSMEGGQEPNRLQGRDADRWARGPQRSARLPAWICRPACSEKMPARR